MPPSEQHIQQAIHNLDFLTSFYKGHLYNDWAFTVGFYSALHILENVIFVKKKLTYRSKELTIEHADELPTCASKENIPAPQNFDTPISPHQFRNILVQENFPDIAEFYMLLYRQSRTARYKRYQFTNNDVNLIVKPALGKMVEWSNKSYSTSFVLNLS